DVIIKPQVSGVIVNKLFKAGDKVKKGQTLFIIEQDQASKDFNRSKALFSQSAISQKEYDSSLATLDHTEIKAPFDGTIGDALVNIGDYVSASTTELVRVTNLNPIYADGSHHHHHH
uniref:A n=1 Tax=Campylobacter jejuni TaxID=197 RepID=UPI0001927A79|nr:Chain A, A [unidentified]2K33_A Chain A, AcrA [unidentified]